MDKAKESCATCFYGWRYPKMGATAMECRRYAPRPDLDPDAYFAATWPDVKFTDWCGEYKQTLLEKE